MQRLRNAINVLISIALITFIATSLIRLGLFFLQGNSAI